MKILLILFLPAFSPYARATSGKLSKVQQYYNQIVVYAANHASDLQKGSFDSKIKAERSLEELNAQLLDYIAKNITARDTDVLLGMRTTIGISVFKTEDKRAIFLCWPTHIPGATES